MQDTQWVDQCEVTPHMDAERHIYLIYNSRITSRKRVIGRTPPGSPRLYTLKHTVAYHTYYNQHQAGVRLPAFSRNP